MNKENEKGREQRLRRLAKKNGCVLRKSRAHQWSINNQQGYMIINERNFVELGGNFELSLDDVEKFLKK